MFIMSLPLPVKSSATYDQQEMFTLPCQVQPNMHMYVSVYVHAHVYVCIYINVCTCIHVINV